LEKAEQKLQEVQTALEQVIQVARELEEAVKDCKRIEEEREVTSIS
jgi:phage shock protein A